jgi:hypothetical protein
MKKYFFLFLLLAAFRVSADNFEKNCGIGILHLDFNKQTDITLCTSSDEKEVAKHITFTVSGEKKNKTATLTTDNKDKWLEPEFLQPEKMILTLRVMERKTNWWYVMVNNRTRDCYWVHISEGTWFRPWLEEIRAAGTVARLDRNQNPIRKSQGSNLILPWDQNFKDCFHPVSCLGVWVELETNDACADGATKIKSGWVRWRDEDGLLITYTLAN